MRAWSGLKIFVVEKLDPALARRPSRFDKKYLFPCPKEPERVLYCQAWRFVSKNRLINTLVASNTRCRQTLAKKNVYTFPESLCEKIAGITEDFTFAYLKELFLSTLLRLAREGVKALEGEDVERPETLVLWQYIQSEAESLRKDMVTEPEPNQDKRASSGLN